MSAKRSPNERKRESVAKLVSRAEKLLGRASNTLNREPEHLSTPQLINLIAKVYKLQQVLTQIENDSDTLLRKLLNRDVTDKR